MKYKVGSIITCTQRGSSRYGAVGVVFFANDMGCKRRGIVRYRVNWFISPSGNIRGDEDIGEYKSDWLENNSEVWEGRFEQTPAEPTPVPEEPRGRFVCLVKGSNTEPKVEHTCLSAACAEAERLANLYSPTVRVAQIVGTVSMQKKIEYIPQWDME